VRQLTAWSLGSIVAGVAALVGGGPFLRALGMQFAIWGAVDLALALNGERDRRRVQARGETADLAAAGRDRRRLVRLLWINAALDVVYVAVGAGLILLGPDRVWAGHGTGVLVQGGFLLVFDAAHAHAMREPLQPDD
jgi:hypothetical protein